jgi:superfamily I DNA/RNA helicase
MHEAAGHMSEKDTGLTVPRSVRQGGTAPWDRPVPGARLVTELLAATRREAEGLGEGRLGVIVPSGRVAELGATLTAELPEVAVGDQPELESRVVVLTVAQAKGLEFDTVLVVDPAGIVAESPRGHSDLYVALTRATQRLGVLRPE